MPSEKAEETTGASVQGVPVQGNFDPLTHFLSLDKKPSFYANGFQVGLTHSECYIIFTQNNAQKVALTLPLSAIKSLKQTLEKVEIDYEKQFGVKVLSIEELTANKSSNKPK